MIRKPFDVRTLATEIHAIVAGKEIVPPPIAVTPELRQNFLISTIERLAAIERSLDVLRHDPADGEHANIVASHFHRLAGTAGSYGLSGVSEVARQAEAECGSGITPETIECLRQHASAIRELISAASTEHAPRNERRIVRLQCSDASIARVLVCDSGFDLGPGFQPDIVITADWDDVRRLRASPYGHRAAVLFLADRRPSHSDLQHADELAIDGFIDPGNLEEAIGRVRAIVDRKFGPPPRVLCVNVDRYASSFASVIESAGYATRVVDDDQHLDVDLEAFDPDLVLAGVDDDPQPALRLLRQVQLLTDPTTCPVVLIAAGDVAELPLAARRAGAADVLRIPLPRALLLATLENRIVAARACRNMTRRDPLTGCLRATSRDRMLAFVEPESALDEAGIVSLADLLRTRLRETDEIARVEGDCFVVAMERISEEQAIALFARLREESVIPFRTRVSAPQGPSKRRLFSARS